MRPLGLGEHGDVGYSTEGTSTVAVIYYRDFSGRRRRVKRSGRSKADARRKALAAVQGALAARLDSEFSSRSRLADAATVWVADFEGLVARGKRSPTTLDMYRYMLARHVIPGVGSLRLGELTTARLDRFLRSVHENHGYAAAKMCRQVLSGMCGLLVRLDALSANPVRDVSRLEVDHDRIARALTPEEVRGWLALLDGHPFAVRHDLPELGRFMLATGLRLGEALGVRWSDVDPGYGTVRIERTVIRVKGQGLRASRLKSRASSRVLVLPA